MRINKDVVSLGDACDGVLSGVSRRSVTNVAGGISTAVAHEITLNLLEPERDLSELRMTTFFAVSSGVKFAPTCISRKMLHFDTALTRKMDDLCSMKFPKVHLELASEKNEIDAACAQAARIVRFWSKPGVEV